MIQNITFFVYNKAENGFRLYWCKIAPMVQKFAKPQNENEFFSQFLAILRRAISSPARKLPLIEFPKLYRRDRPACPKRHAEDGFWRVISEAI